MFSNDIYFLGIKHLEILFVQKIILQPVVGWEKVWTDGRTAPMAVFRQISAYSCCSKTCKGLREANSQKIILK